mmetsp:Transcript_111187/g.314630  ORF Transcript_111187/g.314630 Transcript_111187/m.314630 type:complete len:230 (+) Transcript_111187:549-1238(+)
MPMPAKVNDRPPLLVRVGVLEPAVVLFRSHAAERERGGGKLLAEAHVERHVGVVLVHVQAYVLAGLVPDDEAVVVISLAALLRVERSLQWQQVLLLQGRDHGLEPKLVKDDAVPVHAVRPLQLVPGGALRVLDLRDEQVAELRREELKGEDAGRLLPQYGPGVASAGRSHGFGITGRQPPRPLPWSLGCEKLTVQRGVFALAEDVAKVHASQWLTGSRLCGGGHASACC